MSRSPFRSRPTSVEFGTPASATVTINDDHQHPGTPVNLTATADDRSISLTWDDPENAAISSYEYSTCAGATCSDATDIPGSEASTTSYTITGAAAVSLLYKITAGTASLDDDFVNLTSTGTDRTRPEAQPR